MWLDDPDSGKLVGRPIPDLAKTPFPTEIARYGAITPVMMGAKPGTPAFRHWVAAEALRRSADFWGDRISDGQWCKYPKLSVEIANGQAIDCYYTRGSVNIGLDANFPGGSIYAGESAEVVAHEVGHGVLDGLNPDVWDAGYVETAAFHEAWGDITAILSALQVPEVRAIVAASPSLYLKTSSSLSRFGEQVSKVLRAANPTHVEFNCVRDAARRFDYRDPTQLPAAASVDKLSTECHSFARVFTGAFLEILADMVGTQTDERGLIQTSANLGSMLVDAVRKAPVTTHYFAEVALALVSASSRYGGSYPDILSRVFVSRKILTNDQINRGETGFKSQALVPMPVVGFPPISAGRVSLPGKVFRLKRRVWIRAQPSCEESTRAAVIFARHLVARGDVRPFAIEAAFSSPRGFTHEIKIVGEELELVRVRTDCGLRGS
ncbi:hypothetical protein QO010_000683 [Caulobacter ginsengisoli]|uniref:Peptidase M4 domain-containing protein n=1 Tax=Caulobacter ginsengisoli TaxID=400775 RepID=A0ABU0ILP7_9CAUL|nr:hypothetical protein [Caulobacter ginsengisoli]MDQ0462935.1 hypothetical protein [Caulobacter ginsengisoli]